MNTRNKNERKVSEMQELKNNLNAYEFANSAFGSYNAIIHVSKETAGKITEYFGGEVLPAFLPGALSVSGEDMYMFLLDTEKKVITPVNSVNFIYGNQYNGYFPVGEPLADFALNPAGYHYERYTEIEKRKREKYEH